jgi:hypothetical protein
VYAVLLRPHSTVFAATHTVYYCANKVFLRPPTQCIIVPTKYFCGRPRNELLRQQSIFSATHAMYFCFHTLFLLPLKQYYFRDHTHSVLLSQKSIFEATHALYFCTHTIFLLPVIQSIIALTQYFCSFPHSVLSGHTVYIYALCLTITAIISLTSNNFYF